MKPARPFLGERCRSRQQLTGLVLIGFLFFSAANTFSEEIKYYQNPLPSESGNGYIRSKSTSKLADWWEALKGKLSGNAKKSGYFKEISSETESGYIRIKKPTTKE